MYENTTQNVTAEVSDVSGGFSLMRILQLLITSVGIIANCTLVFAFLNHKQLRCKIPNRFIINQVSHTFNFSHSFIFTETSESKGNVLFFHSSVIFD